MYRTVVLLLSTPVAAIHAQSDWTAVQQTAVWVSASVDHGLSARTSFWFDGHWRRDGVGLSPQQVLLRPGLQFTLRPGLRGGAGYAYVATAPYGESPNPAPLREHRAWQQLSTNLRVGELTLSQRVRLEQRWTGVVDAAGDRGPLNYQSRLRYLVRTQRTLGDRATRAGPIVGFVANEFFLPVGHSDAANKRLQNRVQLGVGAPLNEKQRVELSYLHQWNRITPRLTHEFNHTLVLSWAWTAAAPAR